MAGIAAVVALVVAAAVVLVVVLTGDDGGGGGVATGTTTATTPSSSGPAPTTSSSPSAGGDPLPSGAMAPTGAPAGRFLRVLPADFADCREEPAGSRYVARATCGPSATQPGPEQAQFFQYPDKDAMDQDFIDETAVAGLAQLPAGQDCTTATGIEVWSAGDDTGLVGCWIDATRGLAGIVWTDDVALIEGIVVASGSTQADLADLYRWWRVHSTYRS